ncbi:MAG TPA: phosphoglycerate mutase family protein [Allosphingosinicella sp.]|nr:phosphoglycerate mutase family protein [Allosphingosinicella sp.]
MKLFPALLVFSALAACATTPEASAPEYYVMRHLQKASGRDPALSEAGRAGAERLAALLGKRRPAAIYVSTTRRARETAAPLAAKWKLVPKEYDPGDTAALVQRVLAESGPVLIVGHSNTVGEIVERLGGTRPPDLGETDYGEIWHLWGQPRRTERLRL